MKKTEKQERRLAAFTGMVENCRRQSGIENPALKKNEKQIKVF
jgi:hypothetical protein